MGVFIKRNHGTEYVYVLVGKKHYFIGRKDDPESINIENLRTALKALDGRFDRSLAKYLEDLQTCLSHLPTEERSRYLARRKSDLNAILDCLQYNK